MTSRFLDVFDRQYAPQLGSRAPSFRVMFEKLEAKASAQDQPLLIVETGSLRALGNWADGQSTILWALFAQYHPCEIHSVDLDPNAAALIRENCGPAVQAHTGDSVAFLHGLATAAAPRQIDMLYLDSYDFNPEEPFPSAMHHVKELITIRPCLGPGSLVAIDDNFALPDGQYTGKGYLAMQWFRHLNIACLHAGYQFVWQL